MRTPLKILTAVSICAMLSASNLFGQDASFGQETNVFIRSDLDSLVRRQKTEGRSELHFLTENSVTGRLLHIDKDTEEPALPHDRVFYAIEGNAGLRTGDSSLTITKGAIVYIPANLPVVFQNISIPVDIFELQSLGSMPGIARESPHPASFLLDGVEQKRLPRENVWNSFLRRNSMIFGLYMLPREVGGDSALTHKWDEVNLITKGSGKFQVGEQIMDVQPGDIIYVRKGNPHFFHSLGQDLDILIFFPGYLSPQQAISDHKQP